MHGIRDINKSVLNNNNNIYIYLLLLLLLLLILLVVVVLSIGFHPWWKGRSRTTSGPAPRLELQRQCGGHRQCEEPLLAHTWGVSGESLNKLLFKAHDCTQGRLRKPPWIWRLLSGWNRRVCCLPDSLLAVTSSLVLQDGAFGDGARVGQRGRIWGRRSGSQDPG